MKNDSWSEVSAQLFEQRIKELKKLKQGWLNGIGEKFNSDDLDWFSKTFQEKYPDNLPKPCIFPTVEGRLMLEWSIGKWETSIEIDFKDYTGFWYILDTSANKEIFSILSLGTEEDWAWLVTDITNFVQKS